MGRVFFMPIETSSRDLEYKSFIARKILKNGDVFVFARPWVLQTLTNFFSNINWLGQNCFEVSKLFRKSAKDNLKLKNGQLFYIDEEGGIFPNERAEEILSKRYAKKDLSKGDKIYCWGSRQQSILKKFDIEAQNIGHPRFRSKEFSKPSKKEENLVMTSMTLMMSERNLAPAYVSEEIFNERLYKDSVKNFEKLISFVRHSKENILIRTHPSESRETYEKIFNNLKKVTILPRESLEKSLSRSTKIYHFNCTTSLDAFCYGVKTKDLSDESFTILNDLKSSGDFSSVWLTYPPKIDLLEKDLNTYSKKTKTSITFKTFLIFSCLLLELIYRFRTLINRDKYQDEKFGKFNFKLSRSFLSLGFLMKT